jgi:UDP-N-acetylmuramyl tripeptide synthase
MFMPLPGLYNVYNMLAATAAALSLGVDIEVIKDAVLSFDAAFGRVERIKASGREVLMVLAKNPAGLNEVIRTLSSLHGRIDVVLALNDNIADGRDVSWIWDVDFEMFSGRLRNVVCSGTRAHDMALRVKYAGIGEETRRVEPDLGRALDVGLSSVEREGTLYVVPTYTAMLDLRSIMSKRGLVKQYWEG